MVVLFEVPEESSSTHGHSSTFTQGSSTHVHRYDVFLSFRGVDTRHSFTDHLHKALIDADIATFLDDEEIETGEDLKPELESAIKASQASIIVLSENYATSTWCMDELVLILEQRTSSNHIVIPIFYHVEPFHVRWQEGSFGDAMVKHKQTMEAEIDANKRSQWAQKIDRWSIALLEVANLKGMSIKGRPETKFIEEIVKDIYHRLPITSRSAQPLLIGLEYHINFVASWLKDASSHTTDILTISGMGGIGKTYLANYVYGIHCREFHISSYIEDISRRCAGKFNGLLDIQKQLCDRISKTRSIQVYDGSIYTSKIENAVAREKVFIVLDDIDSTDQLDALLGSRYFHPGSKVIITTRNTWLTESCALFKTNIKPKNESLLLRGLDYIESQQLLCFHAFTYNHPKAGYEEVSNKIVKYCEGHPLALKVFGKSLYNRDVAYWEGCIEGLMRETDARINNVLRLSLDSLQSNNDKELFKYIACYFVGIERDVTETILEACNINTRSGITNLLDRFLLSIGGNNVLKMHQLVQEMGRSEVRHESLDKPWKRSRLWCHKESFRVLKQKKGKGNMVGLALDMRMLEKENLDALQTDVLSNMDSLMLLQLNYVHMNGSYENFPEELRCLCMHGFRLKSIPLELPMRNLVALDMSYSNIESFVGCHSDPQQPEKKQKLNESSLKEKRLLRSLKILNLSFCEHLHSLGDFEQLPALERLIVRNCIDLVEVCESIEQCVELVVIDLSYCNKLKKLPENLYKLKKVKTMWLDGSNLGTSQILIRDMESMETCKTNKSIGINRRTNFTALVSCMPRDLKFFASSLPSSLVRLSLANSNLSTDSFPTDFSCLPMLEKLYLDHNPIDSMPQCVRTLPKIKSLSMMNCNKLKSVEHPPHTLTELSLYSDRDAYTKKVVFNLEMSPLKVHSFSRSSAPGPYEFEGMIKIQSMVDVDDKVLRSLGWTDIDLLKERHVGTNSSESKFQMIYEFGIFSTMYECEEMPNWVRHRSVGPSISFTIPSSPNNLRGLNFSSVHLGQVLDEFLDEVAYGPFPLTPMFTVSNITKNRMWIYERFRERSCNGGNCWVLLSHWMFGRNEMEGGDHVTITVTERYGELIKECGVSLVYDIQDEEEEDALDYYKSWNHIIGGDLSPFQTTTGEYILNNFQFFLVVTYLFPYHRKFIPDGPDCQERYKPWFRALSPRKPNIISGTTSSAS